MALEAVIANSPGRSASARQVMFLLCYYEGALLRLSDCTCAMAKERTMVIEPVFVTLGDLSKRVEAIFRRLCDLKQWYSLVLSDRENGPLQNTPLAPIIPNREAAELLRPLGTLKLSSQTSPFLIA